MQRVRSSNCGMRSVANSTRCRGRVYIGIFSDRIQPMSSILAAVFGSVWTFALRQAPASDDLHRSLSNVYWRTRQHTVWLSTLPMVVFSRISPVHRGGTTPATRCSGCTFTAQANSRTVAPLLRLFLQLGLRIIASDHRASSRTLSVCFFVCCNSLITKLSNSGCRKSLLVIFLFFFFGRGAEYFCIHFRVTIFPN